MGRLAGAAARELRRGESEKTVADGIEFFQKKIRPVLVEKWYDCHLAHVHDLHATILHLLGLDHERLTFRYAGRDFGLTNVRGNVVKDVIT